MKNILLFCLLTFTSIFNNAEAQSYVKGMSVVTAGYGFPDFNNAAFIEQNQLNQNSQNSYYLTIYQYTAHGFGPVFLKYDHALNSLISIGAIIGGSELRYSQKYYRSSIVTVQGSPMMVGQEINVNVRYSSYSAGARLNFHFSTSEKVDPYAGVAVGYTLGTAHATYTTADPAGSKMPENVTQNGNLYFGVTAGMRYYVTKNVGIYGEIGLDKWSLIQLGIAVKF